MLQARNLLLVAAAAADFSPFNYGAGGPVPGLKWFAGAKFGLFMHYGPVTQWEAEISFPLVCTAFPCYPGRAKQHRDENHECY